MTDAEIIDCGVTFAFDLTNGRALFVRSVLDGYCAHLSFPTEVGPGGGILIPDEVMEGRMWLKRDGSFGPHPPENFTETDYYFHTVRDVLKAAGL